MPRKAGSPYQDAKSVSHADAVSEDEQTQERLELDAADEAEAAQERDRSQAIPPREAREPDYE
jgi:hypothetical protein